ncbi:MAG: DUF4037 domain-containing protein [Anaerolineae bacterium]|nr:DUF4037 domain-containing protein [Phycisphaerae bacterium]
MSKFIPGLTLCRLFFEEEVQPIVDSHFRGLKHSAALIGSGSEVLGFDTPMSTDHDWGPRVMLFLDASDHARFADAVRQELTKRLPVSFRGYSTSFGEPDPTDNGTRLLAPAKPGEVRHRVDVLTICGYTQEYLGFDISNEIMPADWLSISEQKLRAFTGGAVYRDEAGLQSQRDRFAYYPRDVWLYQLAATWTRIGQEEHLMGRAGQAGDELGSALIASRLVRDVMRLCFLYERQYAPYAKWFGTAFAKLKCAPVLQPILMRSRVSSNWEDRERELVVAYETIAKLHQSANLTEPLPTSAKQFFNRPFHVIAQHGFANAIKALIVEPTLKKRPIGGIDLISDNTDLLCDTSFRNAVRKLYD